MAPGTPAHALPRAARTALVLTHAGLWWERLAQAFWPAFSVAAAAIAVLVSGWSAVLPAAVLPWAAGVWMAALCAALLAGRSRFQRPRVAEAAARVDSRLAGRPLAALGDRMAMGGPGSDALWRAHLDQAQRTATLARPAPPRARLARRDPFALRLIALTGLAMALLFGGGQPGGQGLAAVASRRPAAAPGVTPVPGPGWEAWAEPPAYTRLPSIYLNASGADAPGGAALTVPQGTVITVRRYADGLAVEQGLGPVVAGAASPAAAPGAVADPFRFAAVRSGVLKIGGHRIAVAVTPDRPPAIRLAALADRRADGRLQQGFAAQDDYGVARGTARITLDLGAVDRRFGLAAPPEPRDALTLDLPLPAAGGRQRVQGMLNADLARHPWANLPVRLTLGVTDDAGQQADTPATAMILPGRRFFDPLAAALIEMRRDLLWSADNAGRSARLLRAMLWDADPAVPPQALSAMRSAVRTLESGPLAGPARDALADALWNAAVLVEDGGLSDALAQMRQARERLSQAIRGGASPDEVRKLMDDLRAATDAYTRMLAQRPEDPAARFDRSPGRQGRQLTAEGLGQMMDEIQRLMNEGRMAEAAERLEAFNRMMDNLQVRQGEGSGQGGSSAQQQLGKTLREQQALADEALRQAQRDPFGDGGARADEGQPGDGRQAAPGNPGKAGDGAEGQPGSLADRQRALRQELGRQGGMTPGRPAGQAAQARGQMDRAGEAMDQAEQALREGDAAAALDRQAEAIEAMREAMRALSDQGASAGPDGQSGEQGQGADGQDGTQGRAQGAGEGPSRQPGRDPLGRSTGGQGGTIIDGAPLAGGEDQPGRARALQDEIRRRSAEPQRPAAERDYLGRLLGTD